MISTGVARRLCIVHDENVVHEMFSLCSAIVRFPLFYCVWHFSRQVRPVLPLLPLLLLLLLVITSATVLAVFEIKAALPGVGKLFSFCQLCSTTLFSSFLVLTWIVAFHIQYELF